MASVSTHEFLGVITNGQWNRMRNGDRNVNVYWACTTDTPKPIPTAKIRSNPSGRPGIRQDFDRLPRARLAGVAFRDTGLHRQFGA
jgi:hypothetical protein